MNDEIKTNVVENDIDGLIREIIPIHPDAKYMILCGPDVLPAEAKLLGDMIEEWYSDPERPIGIVFGDFSLVRVDKTTDEVFDSD